MDWDDIMKCIETKAHEEELRLLSLIPDSDDPGEAFKVYRNTYEENGLIIHFLRKIQAIDTKLDVILEKLG